MHDTGHTNVVMTKRSSTVWVLGSAFSAALVPMLITAGWTAVWFVLFEIPFANWFPNLFPISAFFWVILAILVLQVAGLLVVKKNYEDNERRSRLFASFCTQLHLISFSDDIDDWDTKRVLQSLPSAYVQAHRDRSRSYSFFTRNILNSIAKLKRIDRAAAARLIELWLHSVQLEHNKKPVLLYSLAYVSVWLFVLSAPFILWSSYNWYGLFGLLLIDWPMLAVIYGPGRNVNSFESYETSAFIYTDYDRLAKDCSESITQRLESKPAL